MARKKNVIGNKFRNGSDNSNEINTINIDAIDENEETKENIEVSDKENAIQAIIPLEESKEISEEVKTQIIKIKKISDNSNDAIANKFDLFFIKFWAFIVSMVGYFADGINWIIKGIFKKKAPDRYVKAVVAIILIIIIVVIVTLPFKVNVQREDKIDVFGDNYMPVKVFVSNDSSGYPIYKWGYTDKKGNMKIDAIYEEALPFKHKVAWVRVIEKGENGSVQDYWKLIDKKGNWKGSKKNKMKFYYNSSMNGERPVGNFGDDTKLAWVNVSGTYGFINPQGNIAIETKYDYVENFSEGFARVRLGYSEFFINSRGKSINDFMYEEVKSFSNGMGAVRMNKLWGFIDSKGKTVIAPEYSDVSPFIGGYALVRRNVTYGIIDKKGNYVIEPNRFYDLYTNNEQFRYYIDEMKKLL